MKKMSKSEEKMMYRIIAQTKENNNGITITAETKTDVTHEEAIEIAKKDVLFKGVLEERYTPFIVQPITTTERWKEGAINFCPRCGKSLHEYELSDSESFDCYECNANIDVNINVYDDEE